MKYMRLIRNISVFILLLVVFTGCSSTENVDNNPSNGETLTFTDDLDREVTYTLDRIVADYYVGELLYLDANLVGANLTYTSDVWPEGKLEEVYNVGDSLEEIANLEPTLIITLNQDMVEQYEIIAPTIYIEYGKDKPVELMEKFGVILNKEEEIATVIEGFNNKIEQLKLEIDNPNLTYTIAQDFQGISLYGANWGRGGFILYDYLGLKGTEDAENSYIHKTDSYMTMNNESLLDYMGDVVIIFTDTSTPGYEDNVITQNPLFEETEAYKNNHVFYVDDSYMYDDPYSVEYLLSYYEEMLSSEEL